MLSDSEVQRALVIAAHPDDIDFSAAGTVALWTDAGIEVTYCLATDGDAGGFDDSVPRAEMGPLRRKEQTAAAACVGVHDLRFLGYPDGRVEPSLALRKDLARVIRQVRPDRVLCPSPERNYQRIGIGHPDHRAVGSAALDAVYPDARNPYAFPELRLAEGLEPWAVREVWISAGRPPITSWTSPTRSAGRSPPCGHTRARPRSARAWPTSCVPGWPGSPSRPGSRPATWPRRSRCSTQPEAQSAAG